MKIALNSIILVHGCIHLFGFLKAFNISKFESLSLPISKAFGILWLLVFLLFSLTLIYKIFDDSYWPLLALIAVVLSQIIIFVFWKDAKVGTLPNLIILIASVMAWATFSFKDMVEAERNDMLTGVVNQSPMVIGQNSIDSLPLPVQNWLSNSGVVGKQKIQTVYLTQSVKIKLKPEQTDWYSAKATQMFTTSQPAFNWNVELSPNFFMPMVGRDKFQNGKGEMLIKILSLYPMVDIKNNTKLDEAALQRYLAEISWFPTAALSKYITWEPIDKYSAKATMVYKGTKGSGVFYFDEKGRFKSFKTLRFKDVDKDTQPTEWIATALDYKKVQDIEIPTTMKAEWKLKTGVWKWIEINIESIAYN